MKLTQNTAPVTVYAPRVASTSAGDARHRQAAGTQKMTRVVFEVPDEHAPTLRSVVEELSNQVGKAIEENIYVHEKELSLTRAASVLLKMRAAIYPLVPMEDPDFTGIL